MIHVVHERARVHKRDENSVSQVKEEAMASSSERVWGLKFGCVDLTVVDDFINLKH